MSERATMRTPAVRPPILTDTPPPVPARGMPDEPMRYREDVAKVWFPLATVLGGLAIIALTIALGGS